MRRTSAALIAALLAGAALAGCGSSSSSGSSGSSSSNPDAAVSVSGAFGTAPTVSFPKAKTASGKLDISTAIQGKGPVVASSDDVLTNLALYLWSGTTHKLLQSTFTTSPQILPADVGLTGLAAAVKGKKIGSRILAVLPPKDGYGTSGNSQLGVKGTDTTVWVIDLIKPFSPSASASGTQVSSGGGALPTVKATPGMAPVITITKKTPPSKLTVKTLIQGSGPKTATGDTIIAQYVAENYQTKKIFNSTWPSGSSPGLPFSFKLGGQVIPGFNAGLVGIPVGSRVMLVIPPAEGYGTTGNKSAGITGTDSLVFVVDILDALPAAASS